ncbi:MAG: GNAT family N-acetyltransferase [Rubellimicrobium sp.]|nr:GNAT family N-acetyltransferase [Rubellimicrobium sp.]
MSDVTLRRAVAADVPGLYALLVENAENDGGIIRGGEDALLRWGFGAQPMFRVVLAEAGGEAQGLCMAFPEYSSWRGRVGIFVQDLYLRPHLRGRGLGRALLAQTVRACADWEPAFVTLIVHHHNTAAQAFYAAQGFGLRERADLLVLEGAGLEGLVG